MLYNQTDFRHPDLAQKGVSGFYEEPNRRGPVVLTDEVLKQARGLLDDGLETSEVAEELAVKSNTLTKAIRAGRLHKRPKKKPGS